MNARFAALAAFTAVPLFLNAVAHADPEPDVPTSDPQAACESPASGGVFITSPASPDGVTHAVCQYIVEGQFYYDNYDNGVYTGTMVYRDGAKVPTQRPVMPETFPLPGRLPLVPFPGPF